MIRVPWTTDDGSNITNEDGDIIEFTIDYDFYFLTSPRIKVYENQVYNYDIEVSNVYDKTITIEADSKPSDLSFTQLGNTTARLSGSFSSVGSHDVLISAYDGDFKIYQSFTIEVLETPMIEESISDLGSSILIVYEE